MTDFMTTLNAWESLPFVVSATVGLLFMAMQVVGFGLDELLGGLGLGVDADGDVDLDADVGLDVDADVDLDLDVDADVDLDLDADADIDLDADADVDADVDADADADAEGTAHGSGGGGGGGVLTGILNWFHVGRAPFMVVFQAFLIAFGMFGASANAILSSQAGVVGLRALLSSAPFALAAAAITAKLFATFFARYLPTFETKDTSARTLVGRVAEVESAKVDALFGRASVSDDAGDLFTVYCRMAAGEAPVLRGESVELLRYQPSDQTYLVRRPRAAAGGPQTRGDGPRDAPRAERAA